MILILSSVPTNKSEKHSSKKSLFRFCSRLSAPLIRRGERERILHPAVPRGLSTAKVQGPHHYRQATRSEHAPDGRRRRSHPKTDEAEGCSF